MKFVVGLVFVALCVGIYLTLGYLLCMLEKKTGYFMGNRPGEFDFSDLCFWPVKAIGHIIAIPTRLADHLNKVSSVEGSSEKVSNQNKSSKI